VVGGQVQGSRLCVRDEGSCSSSSRRRIKRRRRRRRRIEEEEKEEEEVSIWEPTAHFKHC